MRLACLLATVAVLWTGAAAQVADNPENWCREGQFGEGTENFMIGTAKGSKNSKFYFYKDSSDNCPEAANCRDKAYLVPGDQILVSKTRGDFSCAWYVPAKGVPRVGWIKTNDFRFPEMLLDASPRAWIGDWSYMESSVSFTNNKLSGWLNVTGDAMWKGLGDNVHVGQLDGRIEPQEGKAVYKDGEDDYACEVKFELVGPYLVVRDNLKCGGVNVSFSGVYTRKPAKIKSRRQTK